MKKKKILEVLLMFYFEFKSKIKINPKMEKSQKIEILFFYFIKPIIC